MSSRIIVLLFIVTLLSSGCATKRKSRGEYGSIASSNKGLTIEEAISKNNIGNKGLLVSKARIRYRDGNVETTFTANIRVSRSGNMMVSLRSFAGIEVARLVVIDDDIFIAERLTRTLYQGSVKVLGDQFAVEKSNLMYLFGDMPSRSVGVARKIKCKNGKSTVVTDYAPNTLFEEIDCSLGKLTSVALFDRVLTPLSAISFENFLVVDSIIVPSVIEMENSQKKFHVKIELEKIEVGWDGDVTFVRPSGYELQQIKL